MFNRNRLASISVVVMMVFLSACVENNYFTAPDDKEPAVELLKLPRFAPADVGVVYTTEGVYWAQLSFDAPNTRLDPCGDLTVSIAGTSVRLVSWMCFLEKDSVSGENFYRFWVSYSTDALGVTDVSVVPRSNPKGRSTFRVTVYPENTKG